MVLILGMLCQDEEFDDLTISHQNCPTLWHESEKTIGVTLRSWFPAVYCYKRVNVFFVWSTHVVFDKEVLTRGDEVLRVIVSLFTH